MLFMMNKSYPPPLSSFQLAQDEGSPVRGFGVVEYESAEQAEAMQIEMDRTLVGGQEVRLSLCTPGTSGRSTLAALIAAQGMVSTWSHDTQTTPTPPSCRKWDRSAAAEAGEPPLMFISGRISSCFESVKEASVMDWNKRHGAAAGVDDSTEHICVCLNTHSAFCFKVNMHTSLRHLCSLVLVVQGQADPRSSLYLYTPHLLLGHCCFVHQQSFLASWLFPLVTCSQLMITPLWAGPWSGLGFCGPPLVPLPAASGERSASSLWSTPLHRSFLQLVTLNVNTEDQMASPPPFFPHPLSLFLAPYFARSLLHSFLTSLRGRASGIGAGNWTTEWCVMTFSPEERK